MRSINIIGTSYLLCMGCTWYFFRITEAAKRGWYECISEVFTTKGMLSYFYNFHNRCWQQFADVQITPFWTKHPQIENYQYIGEFFVDYVC